MDTDKWIICKLLEGASFVLELKSVQLFFRWACQPSRWMALSFTRKGPEKWACPSNQHKQSLSNPFSKIPHEREMSLAKKLVWRELTECYTQATEQTGFWTRQKGREQQMIKYEMHMLKKVKWRFCTFKVVILFILLKICNKCMLNML